MLINNYLSKLDIKKILLKNLKSISGSQAEQESQIMISYSSNSENNLDINNIEVDQELINKILNERVKGKPLAKIINDEKVELALFQGIPNKNFLDQLLSNLGDNWTSAVFSEDKNQTAIISKIGKGSEAFRSELADISMVAFEKDGNLVRYVSCDSPTGRNSQERRELVDWLLKQYRKENELIVVAGNFNFNPHDRWSFLSPMITDSISYDRASWKALSLLGDIFGYSPNSDQPIRRLNMKQEWVIVSPGIELVSKTLPSISISDGSATVMTLRIINSENDLNGNSPSVETLN